MSICIIGASKGVGLCAVKRALARGHHVTTLSRSRLSLTPHINLHPFQGDATSDIDLEHAIAGTDAILVTLGRGFDTRATTLYTDFADTLLKLHKKRPITVPVILLTGFGAGDSREYLTFWNRQVFKYILNEVYINKTEMEEKLSQSSLRWEFVRPGTLTYHALSEKYRVETNLYKDMHIGHISRMDVADFMVKQAENSTMLGMYPALSKR